MSNASLAARLRYAAVAAAALLAAPVSLPAQAPTAPPAGAGPAGPDQARYQEIVHLAPLAGQVAQVSHLVLTRDAGELVLERGTLVLLSPVGGRTVGAVFEGAGRFTFRPDLPTEREALRTFAGTTALDDSITEAILLFTDSTLDQVHGLTFGTGEVPDRVAGGVRDLIVSLQERQGGALADELAGPLFNPGGAGLFLARLTRAHGEPLLFEINPTSTEAVELLHPASRGESGTGWQVAVQFPLRSAAAAGVANDESQALRVDRYTMDVRVTEAFSADLDIAAAATLSLVARDNVGPWLRFALDSRLTADSARWGGASVPVFKGRGGETMDVEAPHPLAAGDTASLTVFYHGDMVERFANLFFIDPGAAWYPINRQGPRTATFDLTFHSPARYTLISIGQRADSTRTGNITTTRWVDDRPTPFATFNIGLFETYHADEPAAAPVDVLYSEEAHAAIRQRAAQLGVFLIEQSGKQQRVAADISNALTFYAYLFGPSPFTHFYVTEIPYAEGVSFPGMIDLSFSTFQSTSLDGFDEYFRAHETAHQWWGNGVLPGSRHDTWLSEGLATFCGLWYLQAEHKRSDDYFRFLDQYRDDIANLRGDAGPIWLAYRDAGRAGDENYQVMTYEKGAWVFNMLRVLMLDLRTMSDDRFTAMLRDYYQTYDGSPASTADFQRVVEQHVGMPMDWFFDEWVKGTGLPTYHVAWTSAPAPGGGYVVRLRVRQEGVDAAFHMPVLVAADLGGGRTARFRVDVGGGQTEYTSPVLPAAAQGLTFDDLHAVLANVKMERW